MAELSHLKSLLSKNLFAAAAEVTKIYDNYYTSQCTDGGSCVIISSFEDLQLFLDQHPALDITNVEYLDVIKEDDGNIFLNMLILAGSEYQYNIFLPKALISQEQLDIIMQMDGVVHG